MLPAAISIATWWGALWSVLEDPVQNGNKEGSCLARTSLGAGHEVPLSQDDRDAVLLHWCGAGVVRQLDISLEKYKLTGSLSLY